MQQRWSRSRWIRSLAARGTWWLVKDSALRSRTKWRTCSTCSLEAVLLCACGSVRSASLPSLLPSDVVNRLKTNTSSSAKHQLHVPARLTGNFLPSHSFYLLFLFSFLSGSTALLFLGPQHLLVCMCQCDNWIFTNNAASQGLQSPLSSFLFRERAWVCVIMSVCAGHTRFWVSW